MGSWIAGIYVRTMHRSEAPVRQDSALDPCFSGCSVADATCPKMDSAWRCDPLQLQHDPHSTNLSLRSITPGGHSAESALRGRTDLRFVGACSFHETKIVAAPIAANSTCVGSGLTPGSDRYERCVRYEIGARRYQ